ncbi:hypothetical protein CEP51_014237 [Fusarium floridanum]|uniref:Uncharacterized protein n=1 Tax=Fusarium floridanum TaxID=1325733 RepID=A0A428PWQ0_9HYPO|nr:hypothetical protein CEP51_014237 [Fusarium floridanum]
MAVDSTSSTTSLGISDLPHSSMLLPFIHDTSSFSDRQVQVANAAVASSLSTTKGYKAIQCCPNDVVNHSTEGKEAHKASESRSRDNMFGVAQNTK